MFGMALVLLKCPNCGGSLDLEDSREFAFCQYCGSKIMIQEEIVRQKVTIDRSEDLKNVLKLAIVAFTEHDLNKVKDLANKALEMDANCSDAMYLKVATVKATGGDYQTLMELAKGCTNNLGIFSEEDVNKYLGHRVSIRYSKKGCILEALDATIDNHTKIQLPGDVSKSLYLPSGPHVIAFSGRTGPHTLPFEVKGESEFVISLGKYSKFSITPSETPRSGIRKTNTIKLRMPDNYMHTGLKFHHFEVNGSTAPNTLGQCISIGITPGPQSMKFVEVCKKGLLGIEKYEYTLVFDAETGSSYTIYIKDSDYLVKKD